MNSRRHAGLEHLWVLGPGRVGLSLGLLLSRESAVARLSYSGRNADPPAHPLFQSPRPASYSSTFEVPADPPSAIILAVPDDVVAQTAAHLAGLQVPPGIPVLHLSGSLGSDVLAPLAEAGHPTGSLHPLVAVSDPVGGADSLVGAWYGVEGDEPVRGLAKHIIRIAGGQELTIRSGAKPVYHAAAVFASNYAVVLMATAERLMGEAGVESHQARAALTRLAAGAIENVGLRGPVQALTGPVARGDAAVVAGHLANLSGDDQRLYSALAGATLKLARDAGLDEVAAERIERLLGDLQ